MITVKTGKLKRWDKKIPASGKTIVNFAGVKLMIKELKAGTWVVLVETGGIIGFFSNSWKREDVLDYIAGRIEDVKVAESYETYSVDEDVSEDEETSVGYSCASISMEYYSDGTPVKQSQSKKRYDFTKKGW